ncbi:hypothetical protein TI04_07525, partial [Achromatium sp. WMS2]
VGSCFRVCIPVPVVNKQITQVTSNNYDRIVGFRSNIGTSTSFDILVVDDVEENCNVVKGLLEPLGFKVTEVFSGPDAINITKNRIFDMIFMDLVMPDMDGLTAARIILKRPETINKQIVALTARAYAEDRIACMEAGCLAHLSKPVQRKELLQVLKAYLPLEWKYSVYQNEARKSHNNEASINPEHRAQLLKIIKQGAIIEAVKYLKELVQTPGYPEQANTLLELAKEFKLADIRHILENDDC